MGFAKVRGRLTSRIGRPVRYGAPKDVRVKGGKARHGIIIDEIWVNPDINKSSPRKTGHRHDWGDYSFCAQLIKWEGDDEHYSIRLAYYRRRCGENWWEFAGQTTVSSGWKTIKALCEKTLSKTWWFQNSPKHRFPRLKG
jgi:hypothetical protein